MATFDRALGGRLGARINNLKVIKLIDKLGPRRTTHRAGIARAFLARPDKASNFAGR